MHRHSLVPALEHHRARGGEGFAVGTRPGSLHLIDGGGIGIFAEGVGREDVGEQRLPSGEERFVGDLELGGEMTLKSVIWS
jgi:hypothetical protein